MVDTARLQLEVDSRQVIKGEQALDEFTEAGARAENQTKDLAQTTRSLAQPINNTASGFGKAANQSNAFASNARNLSLQLSQVAQQGAATGNFAQALAIQLPDLLLGFGTLGILIGAAAGALAGPLTAGLRSSADEAKRLGDEINDLNEDFSTLTDSQQAFLISASQLRQSTIRDEIQGLGDDISDAEEELRALESGFRRTARGQRIAVAADPEAIQEARNNLVSLNAELDTRNQALEREAKLQADIAAGVDERLQKERESASLSLASLQGQFDPVVAAQQAFEQRNQVIQDANAQGLVEQEQFDSLRLANAEQLQDDLTQIEESGTKQRQRLILGQYNSIVGATGQFFGNLAQIAQAGGKDQFDNYKNLASAQAAVAASLSIASVLGDPNVPTFLKVPLATSIGALAAVQVAQIQSQEFQPRALGGQMRAGGSFLVGERGPELITMGNRNANITPNNQLGSGTEPVQLTNVFQISTGVSETVEAEFIRLVPLMENIAVNAVNKSARNGGTTSRILGAR